MKVVGLVSGGKDSVYNLLLCQKYGHEVVALANLLPSEDSIDELDSFMYQTVGHQLIEAYAQCAGLPLFRRRILGASKHQELNYAITEGDEVEDLLQLLAFVKHEYPEVQAVSSGAIASDYQRLRVEHVCSRLGLISLAYMWMQPQRDLLQGMIDSGVEAVLVKVAALGLEPHKHLGKSLREMQPLLHHLNRRFGCNVCGEGGEYETLCLDSPLFLHGRIVLDSWEPVLHSPDQVASVGVLHPIAFHEEPKIPHPSRSREEAASIAEAASPLEAAYDGKETSAGRNGSDESTGSQRTAELESEVTTATKQSAADVSYHSSHCIHATQMSSNQEQSNTLNSTPPESSGQMEAEIPLAMQGAARVIMVPDDYSALLPPRCGDRNSLADSSGSIGSHDVSVSKADVSIWQSHSFIHASCSPEVDSLSLPEADSLSLPEADILSGGCVARTELALHAALAAITKELGRRGYHLRDALLVQLYLADMAHFAAANAIYQRYFPQVRPAARACVQAPLPLTTPIAVDILLPSQGAAQRRVLHVQGISCWAPSCIGPYSQATALQDLVFFAGQIGLDPPTMQLLSGVPAQVERSFASCQAVAIAMGVALGSDLLGVTLFSSTAGGGRSAWQVLDDRLRAYQGIGDEESEGSESEDQATDVYLRVPERLQFWQPLTTFLVMPALPRGAAVEVQPLTCCDVAFAKADDISSEEEGDLKIGAQELRPGWLGKLHNETGETAVRGSEAPLQRNLLLANEHFCLAQLSWPSSTQGMHPISKEELLSVLQAIVRGLTATLQSCGLQRQDTVSLCLYYRPDLLATATAPHDQPVIDRVSGSQPVSHRAVSKEVPAPQPGCMDRVSGSQPISEEALGKELDDEGKRVAGQPALSMDSKIQPLIDRVLREEGWADTVAVCVPVLAVGWCANASAAVHFEGLFWAQK